MTQEAKRQGVEFEAIDLDLQDPIDRSHALRYDVDILVNNAGIVESGAMTEIPVERVRESFETNVFSHLEPTQGFVRKMIGQGHGKVVWISFVAGIRTTPSIGAYSTAKHAVETVAWAMMEELEPYHIMVATFNPGPYLTGFNDTGAISMLQCHDPGKDLFELPDAGGVLSRRYDPRDMIDVMLRLIPADRHLFRTVHPKELIDDLREFEAEVQNAEI